MRKKEGGEIMKLNKIPFKEKQRHYHYQFNQTDRQEELCMKKAAKELRKLKEQAICQCRQNDSQ